MIGSCMALVLKSANASSQKLLKKGCKKKRTEASCWTPPATTMAAQGLAAKTRTLLPSARRREKNKNDTSLMGQHNCQSKMGRND
ncbi:hypothetical protein H6P81_015193 [Aristolochia fimbriata]|uniref:Secreted protein n=1 Tax=Aristolochia fimbriata TaxID=158543 RepID=A0AAV7E9C8_ARIFI|nr:hypothetical protein H6P81_015193 [Aristolochia fimbriata]